MGTTIPSGAHFQWSEDPPTRFHLLKVPQLHDGTTPAIQDTLDPNSSTRHHQVAASALSYGWQCTLHARGWTLCYDSMTAQARSLGCRHSPGPLQSCVCVCVCPTVDQEYHSVVQGRQYTDKSGLTWGRSRHMPKGRCSLGTELAQWGWGLYQGQRWEGSQENIVGWEPNRSGVGRRIKSKSGCASRKRLHGKGLCTQGKAAWQ